MKKLTVLAIAVIFIFGSVGAYACGDENSTAKKVDASKADGKVVMASAKNYDANVEKTGDKAECSTTKQAKAQTANSSSCCPAGKAKATTADMKAKSSDMKAKTAGYECPASVKCDTPCDSNAKAAKAKTAEMSKKTEKMTMAENEAKKDK